MKHFLKLFSFLFISLASLQAFSEGSCPSQLPSCPSGYKCGCYIADGLRFNKQKYIAAGANKDFLTSAMMETEKMTTDYKYGDGKTGDSFNAGAAKQNWSVMRSVHPAWKSKKAGDYKLAAALNNDRALDVAVYKESINALGKEQFFNLHRGGNCGAKVPNHPKMKIYRDAWYWINARIAGHETDDVRFWVDVPAVYDNDFPRC